MEERYLSLKDESTKKVFNAKGTPEDIAPELKEMLVYLDRQKIIGDFAQDLNEAVKLIKAV